MIVATTPPVWDVVLASSSVYRRQLIERLGLEVRSVSPNIDESAQSGERPDAYVRRLACEKAWAVLDQAAPNIPCHSTTRTLVIGSDQSAVIGGERLGKPGSFENAVTQLRKASGRRVEFLTSVAVVDGATRDTVVDVVPTSVSFRPLTLSEIERYIRAETPYDCAGGFKSEGLGICLFDALESNDPTALIGLPLIRLCKMLRAFGVALP